MLKTTVRAASAALLLAATPLLAADPQQPVTPQPVTPQPGTVQPKAGTVTAAGTGHIRAKQVLGTKVLIAGNTGIGTVDDLVFDEAGNLEYLIVANEANKLVSVPWDAARWDLEKKVGTLSITAEQYRTIPTFTATTYPSFYTPAYRTETYKFYGLTPRELRRLDRRNP